MRVCQCAFEGAFHAAQRPLSHGTSTALRSPEMPRRRGASPRCPTASSGAACSRTRSARLVWAAAMGRDRGAFGGEADGDDSDLDEPADSFDDDEDMVTGSFDEPPDEEEDEEDEEEEFGARASRFDDDGDDDVGGSDADQDEPVGLPDAAYDSADDEAAASDEEGAGSLGAFEGVAGRRRRRYERGRGRRATAGAHQRAEARRVRLKRRHV